MSPKEFEKYLKMVGWYLEKGKIDWNLYNEKAHFICSVKISHGSRTKSEVAASSVKKVKKEFEEKGFVWPPRKKSKKS
jgi:predicted RNA binding protein YcfA (HicA-like mRNA interferase family)